MTMHSAFKLAGAGLAIGVAGCSGDPNCTSEPRSAWMSEAEMKKRVADQGYEVKEFKISGACYEIYGWDRDGRKVEVYFNPVNGTVFKSEVD